MATLKIYLPPPKDRRSSPFFLWRKINCDGVDNYEFHAGWNLNVPIHWKIHALKIGLNASVEVGNRYIYLVKHTIQQGLNEQIEELTTDQIQATEYKFLTLDQMSGFVSCSPGGDMYATLSPDAWIFSGDDYLFLYIQGDLTGDKVHIRMQFKFLNWELGIEPPLSEEKAVGNGHFWQMKQPSPAFRW